MCGTIISQTGDKSKIAATVEQFSLQRRQKTGSGRGRSHLRSATNWGIMISVQVEPVRLPTTPPEGSSNMADDNRIDLSKDLEELSQTLLKDVAAATDEVKQRKAAIKKEEEAFVQKGKSRKLMGIMVGAAFVIIVMLAVVFAKPGGQDTGTSAATPAPTPAIKTTATTTTPSSTNAPISGGATANTGGSGRDSQLVRHPSDDYERPSGDSGM